ncbi:hypothetical protein WMY93_022476 [Mugilogobius chulae]|uniref:TOG domain-containing protein n=1 Tax=Mugilogobius chulae TaxID=88201 RepID=A0AAW0NBD6_9GOBI
MAEQQQFLHLAGQSDEPRHNIRKQSEETYDSIPGGNKITFLLQAIRDGAVAEEVRQMAAVLLRRLLSSAFEEKVCDIAAELSRNLIDDDGNNQWPEVLKFLFDSVNSDNVGLKEAALHIFWNFPGIFGNQQQHYLDVIKRMLVQCMQDQTNPQIRMLASRAAASFVLANEGNAMLLKHFSDLLPGILQSVNDSCYQGDDSVLKSLVEIADTAPKYLRPNLEATLQLCLKLCADTNLTNMQRQLSLEVIVTLSETAAAMLRKHQALVAQSVPQMLAMMVDLEEDDEWAQADELEDDDFDSNAVAGESALDRIACGLGGKIILPIIKQHIMQMLQNSDWKYRHAGLMALSAIGEGCHQQMETILGDIVRVVLEYCADPHPRVRYAACNAIGQMATDFAPTFQKNFHKRVIEALLATMKDHGNPRVQAHAAAALINFTEDCPKSLLVPYLFDLVQHLSAIMQAKLQEVQSHMQAKLQEVQSHMQAKLQEVQSHMQAEVQSHMQAKLQEVQSHMQAKLQEVQSHMQAKLQVVQSHMQAKLQEVQSHIIQAKLQEVQSHMQAKLQEVQSHIIQAKLQEVQSHMQAKLQEVQSHMQAKLQEVQSHMQAKLQEVQSHMQAKLQEVQSHMQAKLQEVQ